MTVPAKKGPKTTSVAETLHFISKPRWAALGCEDEDGELYAIPAWIEEGRRRSANARQPPFSGGPFSGGPSSGSPRG